MCEPGWLFALCIVVRVINRTAVVRDPYARWCGLTITHKYERGLEFWFPFEDGNVYFKKLFGQFSHFYIIGKHSPGIR